MASDLRKGVRKWRGWRIALFLARRVRDRIEKHSQLIKLWYLILLYYKSAEKEIGSMEEAHDGMIWDMSWHPLGHMLVSGSNDRSTRFWTRNRPGDTVVDKNEEMPTQRLQPSTGIIFKNFDLVPELDKSTTDVVLPGLGLDSELLEQLKQGF